MLSKMDLADSGDRDRIRATLSGINPRAVVFEAAHGQFPWSCASAEPGLTAGAAAPRPAPPGLGPLRDDDLDVRPANLAIPPAAAIGRLAPKLVRAKGLFETVEIRAASCCFKFRRRSGNACPGWTALAATSRVRIVFIAEIGALSAAEIDRVMGRVRSASCQRS